MSEHVISVKTYLTVFVLLLVLTGVTVAVAYVDLGLLSTPVALTIAVAKGLLVVLYFMHVRHSSKLTWLFAAAGFFWLVILIAFTVADFATRDWMPYYGPALTVEQDPDSIQRVDTRRGE